MYIARRPFFLIFLGGGGNQSIKFTNREESITCHDVIRGTVCSGSNATESQMRIEDEFLTIATVQ